MPYLSCLRFAAEASVVAFLAPTSCAHNRARVNSPCRSKEVTKSAIHSYYTRSHVGLRHYVQSKGGGGVCVLLLCCRILALADT